MNVLTVSFIETTHESEVFLAKGPYFGTACLYIDETLVPERAVQELIAYCREFLPLPEWITDATLEIAFRYECYAAAPSWVDAGDEHVSSFRVQWGPWEPDGSL